ncbi:MAG TPA: T9SS type A sorting domain-containing protein [Flavisolibacter sp.]|nr:T9SS type A sorting domain-containing protein [Flavisolibacter sp.]
MKKLLLILSIILLTTIHSQAQQRTHFAGVQSSILRFYPNPATTTVNFDFQGTYGRGYSIVIYNFLGRKMYDQVNLPERATINLTDFSRGVYIYQLRDKSNQLVESGKFQVVK